MLLAWVGLSSWCFGAVELKEAEITTIKNIVEKDEGGGAQPAKTNDKIYEKAKVTTAAASMAELTFVDSSITRMGANTLFSFQSKERLIKLDQGTVLIHTPPGNGGATVDCGGVTASVTGTTFMASRDKVGNSVFVLLEGAGGMKITVGGTSTTIRPGQAASVGASVVSDAGGKTEDKATTGTKVDATGGGKEAGQGKEQEATGKPNPDTSGTGGGKAGGETSGGAGTLPPGNTGGGDAGAGSKSTPSAVAQAPAAAPAPLKTPEIKVFEVDVKKVVQTTPLITGFKTELPSAKKIEATIQVQQAKVAEGKIEKLEVEVVAVSHADGDLLVGAPQVEKEDMKIVNSKESVAEKVDSKMAENTPGKGPAGDGLDIATAAGPESGGNNTAVTTARSPKVETPGPQPTATTPPPINPGQTVVQQPAPTAPIAVTARVDDASRFYNQANPAFGFSITSGSLLPGHSLVGNFLTAATTSSGVTGSPYAVSLSNTKIVNSAGEEVTSRYNLTTVAGVLNVLKAAQSVAFDSIGSLTFRQEANLVAKALAGEVKVEVVSGPATVTNGKLVANSGTGTVVIRATTPGNENYNGAFAEQTITLAKAPQILTLATLPTLLTGSSVSLPTVSGAQAGAPTFSILETDGRASIDSLGNLQIGKILGADSFTVRATAPGNNNYLVGQQDFAVGINPDVSAIYAANPARRLLLSAPTGDELTVLDQFFYYTGKASGVQGPGTFYPTDYQNRFLNLANLGSTVELYPGQAASYYFGSTLGVGSTASTVNLAGKDAVIYANSISLGAGIPATSLNSKNLIQGGSGGLIPDGNAAGLYDSVVSNFRSDLPHAVRVNLTIDPLLANDAFLGDYVAYLRHTSANGLDTRTVKLFEHIGATTAFPEGSAGTGLAVLMSDWATDSIAPQDPAGILTGTYRPGVADQLFSLNDLGAVDTGGDWTLWVGDTSSGGTGKITSWSIELEQLLQPTSVIDLTGGVGKTFTTAAGDQGLAVKSTWMKANGANLEFLSTSSLEMSSTQMSGVGSQFLAEAVGSVKMGAQSTPAVPSPSVEAAEREQVRILADTVTDAGGVAVAPPGSMAVIRSGDSLELRNVTIRNFEGTKLEKVQNGVTTGRVLMSGSMVRDFKIKELVGAAVNADAKIQMTAIDGNGALAGEMTVEGSLPVATKLASALAVANETLPSETADAQVHALEINLSADRLNFQNNANLVAMNAITARANTILVQNSFMTVVRNSGMINMYVSSGMVNQTWGSVVAGQVNFAGLSNFRIGNMVNFSIANSGDIASAMSSGQLQQVSTPQAGKVNVLKL